MKKWLLLFLLLVPLATANLYQQDKLQLELSINGGFDLISEGSGTSIQDVSAELLLYPEESYRQSIIETSTDGVIQENSILYVWDDKIIEPKSFSYTALIETKNTRNQVRTEIPFPLTDVEGYEQYLEATENIDADHPEIIAQATALAEGENDLFKVVFNLAEWVEKNIDYDLNTITATASQKASWVLENKEGVCDEMTSLFVAMARSLGIPARFTSGISYTEDPSVVEYVGKNWASHGWAEVYFPTVGWVSFDITFNEFGYVDVTHIKLRDGFDPAEPATKYEWFSDGVSLSPDELDLQVNVQQWGTFVPEEIVLEQEILSPIVGFGSFNLVKGILKNTANYYVATTLKLAVPQEIAIDGRNRRSILLGPKEVKETYWIVEVPEDLTAGYSYTFPSIIYSEKNASVEDAFQVKLGEAAYTQAEIEALTVQDEEKTYSRQVTLKCTAPDSVQPDTEATVSCTVKNSGNTNLYALEFCVAATCESVDLPINQEDAITITVVEENPGWQNVVVTAENDLVEKRTSVTYAVVDSPKLVIEATHPAEVKFSESIPITLAVDKTSFTDPVLIEINLAGAGFINTWSIDEFQNAEELEFVLKNYRLASTNTLDITATWQDEEGNTYTSEQQIVFTGTGSSFGEKVKLFLNRILNIF